MADESNQDAESVEKPERAPDRGKAYDPSMNVEDEANIPPESAADAGGDKPDATAKPSSGG